MKWLDFQAITILLSTLGFEIQSYALVLPSESSFIFFNPVGTRPQDDDIRKEWDGKIEEGYIPLIQLSSEQSSNQDINKIVNYLISCQYLSERFENNIKFLQINPTKSPIDFLIGLLNIYTSIIKNKHFLPITIPVEIMGFIKQNIQINTTLERNKDWFDIIRGYLNRLPQANNNLGDALWTIFVYISPKPNERLDLNVAIYNMLAAHQYISFVSKPLPLRPFQRPPINFINASPIPTIVVSAPGYRPPNRLSTRRRVLSVIRESRTPSPRISPLHSPKVLPGVRDCGRTPGPRVSPTHSPELRGVASPPIPAGASAFIFPS